MIAIKRNGKSKIKQSEFEKKIRVGRDYQAVCPQLIPEPERNPDCLNDRALLVWSPTKEISDTKHFIGFYENEEVNMKFLHLVLGHTYLDLLASAYLIIDEYKSIAKEKYGYNGEQALGMLFWHKHDLESAEMDLANFAPCPDEWTIEDKVIFEKAFQFHGKNFRCIRQMLPDKSMASLVKFYYSWKKTWHGQEKAKKVLQKTAETMEEIKSTPFMMMNAEF